MLKRKIISLFFAAVMLVSALPASAPVAHAEEAEPALAAQEDIQPLTEITGIVTAGVQLPEPGAHPDTSWLIVPSGLPYTLQPGSEWYSVTDMNFMDASDVFEAGKDYMLMMDYAPNEGYCFADNQTMTFEVVGAPSGPYTYMVLQSGGAALGYPNRMVYCTFSIPDEAHTIRNISLNGGPLPVLGQTLSLEEFGLSAPEGAHYYVADAMWLYGGYMGGETLPFEHEEPYQLHVQVLPEPGYAFAPNAELTAELAEILSVRYELQGVSKTIAGGMLGGASVYFSFTPRASWVSFTDVADPSLFYFDPVYWCADRGYVTGWTDGTFRPNNTCNRAAVVTFLWRMAGRPEPTAMAAFSDMTGNEDFDKAISWAAENGITTGFSDNTFRPWQTCNRAAIVTFLWRFAGEPEASAPAAFSDMTGNEDFDSAISWAVEHGIVTGWADNTFRPWNQCLRLAVVSFLYRYAMDRGIG